jgi:hypothetical protein
MNNSTKVQFQPSVIQPYTWREQIVFLQESQSRVSRGDKGQDHATVSIKSKTPIGIALSSDWHIGSLGTNYQKLLEHLDLIRKEPNAFMTLLSNTIDNFIFPSGQFAQAINPSDQIEIVKGFAKEYDKKILAIVGSRCHEGWSTDKVDINPNELMFQHNIDSGMPFLKKGGVLDIQLNNITYSFGLVHKGRGNSAVNPTNAARSLFDNRWPVDVLAVAHHHVKQVLHGTRWEGKYKKEVLYIRTGAYKIDDDYSELEGFGKGQMGCPMVVLDPNKRRMIPFFNLEDGIEYLRLARKGNE